MLLEKSVHARIRLTVIEGMKMEKLTLTTGSPYITYVNGVQTHLGFKDLTDAENSLKQHFDTDKSLVIHYMTSDANGNRAQYYDHVEKKWIQTNMGLSGAIKLSTQISS
jgi:hypothetical protein